MINNKNLESLGGGGIFNTYDSFITKNGDSGIVIRRANIIEYGNVIPNNGMYYVVEFNNGNNRLYNNVINIPLNGAFKYVIQDIYMIPQAKCKINVGQQVIVTGYIGLQASYTIGIPVYTNVYNKYGTVLYVEFPNIVNKNTCTYNIKFSDNTFGIKVPEYMISRNLNIINSPFSPSLQSYIDVNNILKSSNNSILDISEDRTLQDSVTDYYHKKILKWIDKKDIEFAKFKKHKKFLNKPEGKEYVHTTLKLFLKKHRHLKWYDLRSDDNYEDVKEFIRTKIANI